MAADDDLKRGSLKIFMKNRRDTVINVRGLKGRTLKLAQLPFP